MQQQLTVQQKDFNWSEELHKTLVTNLATIFGLDFLLLEDKKGGDVDTIHNVNQGIYATEYERQRYENRGEYKDKKDEMKIHSSKEYIDRGKVDKKEHKSGKLYDIYRNKNMDINEDRQLDHIVSAKELHDNRGRVLAEVDTVRLSNTDKNFNSTNGYVNRIKSCHSMNEFLNKVAPNQIKNLENQILKNEEYLKNLDPKTPQERHNKDEIISKIKKLKENKLALEDVIKNKDKALEADRESRDIIEKEINSYYTSTKFFKSTALAAGKEGFKMGTRQALGLLLAEVWFELREQIPQIYQRCKQEFMLEKFLTDIKQTLGKIWERVKDRFSDMLAAFKDGAIGGVFSNINKTVLNIFMTTERLIGKLLREVWGSLVKAAKLIIFNPNKLALGDLAREVTRLLSMAVSVAIGVVVNQHLESMWALNPSTVVGSPVSWFLVQFGSEIAAFLGALTTGLLTLGFTYFIDHSEIMQKVWSFLNSIKSKYAHAVDFYQKVNAELDRYLTELSKIEFNMNPAELEVFAEQLSSINDEYQLSNVIGEEIKRRNIDLPFEFGNKESFKSFLKSKCRKS